MIGVNTLIQQFAMNTSLQNTTKFTLFYMMFGRNPCFTLEAEKEAESSSIEKAMDDIAKADADEYIGNIVEKQKTIFPKADSNIKAAEGTVRKAKRHCQIQF